MLLPASASPPSPSLPPALPLCSEPAPVTSRGPAFPPVAVPPAPPVAVAVCVLVAVLSCLHWLSALVLPVASWLQTAELLPLTESDVVWSATFGSDPELSRPEIWLDCWFSRLFSVSALPPLAYASPP